ncbi:hypothetical protein [Rhizobium sp. BK176]|uniref:hypothetical protein n=1 Tax=Rhizobium sp. BK176 TaxID=2587071 RepID=UPI00216776BF|nr:hypothetical protein [Rhizobium sp. BK176]MCS4088813.1 hypothetical protein [Rhizobium sp. BK176]
MSESTYLTDNEINDAAELHDHVYDMFFAQNAIIDMDSRFDITELRFTGDDSTKDAIADYATTVETFLKFAADNPEKVARTLAILKGGEEAVSATSTPG